MKAFMQKHAASVALALCLLTLGTVSVSLFAQSAKGTYAVRDVRGDAAVLASLELPLVQYDGLHEQMLTFSGGSLAHRFQNRRLRTATDGEEDMGTQFLAVPATDAQSSYKEYTKDVYTAGPNGGKETKNVLERTVDRVSICGWLTRGEGLLGNKIGEVYFDTGVTYNAAPCVFTYEGWPGTVVDGLPLYEFWGDCLVQGDTDGDAWVRRNAEGNVRLGGADYVAVWTGPGCEGTAGIFRVDAWTKDGASYAPQAQDGYALSNFIWSSGSRGKVTRIAAYPAKDTQTLRMDAVGETLCLLLIQDDVLTLRAYSTDGTLLYDAPLCAYAADNAIQSVGVVQTTDGENVLAYRLRRRVGTETDEAAGTSAAVYETTLVAVRAADGALLSRLPAVTGRLDAAAYADCAFAQGRWVFAGYGVYAPTVFQELAMGDLGVQVLDAAGTELAACRLWTDAWEDGIAGTYAMGNTQAPKQYSRMMRALMQALCWR